MPSLSPSQSSTDQSSSTITTTTSNNNSSSTNGRLSSSSSSSIKTTTNDEKKDKVIKKSNNSHIFHRKKLLQVVTFLDQQNQHLEKELQNEKARRNEELSHIVKSLLYFEAKLKSEKKAINQKLYEKDDEILRLVKLNRSLKKKLEQKSTNSEKAEGGEGGEVENLDDDIECKYPEALFCSNCRKEFYELNDQCDNWTQTSGKITDGRISCKCENNNNIQNNNSTEHCSSSDETLSSSFYGARRSVRYTSKRTFGTFREYMRSRSMNIDDPSVDINNLSDENRSTLSHDEFSSQNNSNKRDRKFSIAIERLHGVRRVSSFEFDSSEAENRSHKKHFSSSGPDTDNEHVNSPNDEGIEDDDDDEDDDDNIDEEDEGYDEKNDILRKNRFKSLNVGVTTTINSKEFSETSIKQDFETSTDDWYASASDADDDQNSSVCRKSYGYNAVNPVLECVNQILLQQSMEDCVNEKAGIINNAENHYHNSYNGPISIESTDNNISSFSICSGGSSKDTATNSGTSNATGNGSRKRVHFSTKNSMVHVPRDDDEITEQKPCAFPDGLNSSITSEHQSSNLNYESIYSNEYEPIGSEQNSSNLYVDMESKLDQDERFHTKSRSSQQNHQQNKQPPALPPKPANLIKFKRLITKGLPEIQTQKSSEDSNEIQLSSSVKLTKELLEKVDGSKNEKYGSEPDYCSISEVNVGMKTIQIIADVHKSNDTNSSSAASISGDNSDTMSQKTSDDVELFADIPKLPNVAAIIAPSKNKSINLDNALRANKQLPQKPESLNNFSQTQHMTLQLQQKQQQLQQRPQSLQLYRPKSPGQVQRKHVPNILAEINKKIQQANVVTAALSPTSPNKVSSNFISPITPTKRKNPNQLLPILKSPSSTNKCIDTLNTKNINNILFSSPTTCKNTQPVDLIKINQQKLSPVNSQRIQQKQKSPTKGLQKPPYANCNKNSRQQQTKIEDSLPLEAEFDWYNLDAEYGKSSNRPDIVKAADVLNDCLNEYILANGGNLHEHLLNDENQTVEYNLDEEFSLSNQPDIIKENIRIDEEKHLEPILGSDPESNKSSPNKISNNNSTCLDQIKSTEDKIVTDEVFPQSDTSEEEKLKTINESLKETSEEPLTIINSFPTICDQTPCRQSVNLKQKNFVEFIDNAGLSTKTLPSQRKIYFTGPFV